jgi:hypothetical protein
MVTIASKCNIDVMKLICAYLLLSFLMSCDQPAKQPQVPIHNPVVKQLANFNYDSCKKQIKLIKQQHKSEWHSFSIDQKEKFFTAAVAETIIPNWIGTKWDFNGTTEIPQQGSIACGYFVTTVLRDAGVSLARVKLAQCASEQMIQSLVQPALIHRYSNVSITDFASAITKEGYGLYIVGLDNHTGFIYNDGKNIYFIHSTFVGTRNVQQELAVNSIVLKQSKYKVVGKISADATVLARWIN